MTLVARIGEGGMATVYLAAVGRGGFVRPAAVKLLRRDLPDEEYRTRFLDEARVVVRLHHNNLVDVRAAGEEDGQLYIAMELVEGRDLADVWDRCADLGRPIPVPLAVHVVREVLRGLHYAHTREGLGLVHRDVSPSNILLDWQGAVRLADFGLATSAIRNAVTLPGIVFGKVGYMSPEQARREVLDARSDVYACGVVLWELVTGRPLREPGTDTSSVARGTVPPASTLSRRVDAELDAIVARATANDRDERYPTAGAMLEALSGWLAARAPACGQETVAAFLREIFGDVAARERAEIRELLLSVAGSDRTLVLSRTGPRRRAVTGGADMSVSAPYASFADEDRERLEPGTIVAGRYRVAEMLGRGGMGAVYLAEHLAVGRSVAIKVLSFAFSNEPTIVERFRAEARTASSIGHPNIVEVFDAGQLEDGRLYLVMELLSGQSLYDVVEQEGPQPVDRALRWLREVARALRAAHQVGVVHRDLKPENVMLARIGEEERIKVLDFGISARSDGSAGNRLTQAGQALGTPEYMAPEQARGEPPTPSIDIYAFGVLAFELLAGHPPIAGGAPAETIARKLTERPPPMASVREDVPAALASLVDRCLESDPSRRPSSMDEVLGEVEAILRSLPRRSAGHASSAPPTAATEDAPHAPEAGRRRPTAVLVAAAGLVVVAGVIGWVAVGGARDEPGEQASTGASSERAPAVAPPGDPNPPAQAAVESAADGAKDVSKVAAAAEPGDRAPAAEETRSEGNTPAGPSSAGAPSRSTDAAPPRTETRPKKAAGGASTRGPDSAACAAARREAERAAAERRWKAVLRATRRAACFPDRAERRKLRMQAHKELGDFEACLGERGPSSPTIARIEKFCRKRLGR
ncbi:MAG: serine/threonine protein kinase [Deltaproteobacteria bacterium]|nr:MAG: serine/threonine protein kinase [Deltaproteobacteria bacterium]